LKLNQIKTKTTNGQKSQNDQEVPFDLPYIPNLFKCTLKLNHFFVISILYQRLVFLDYFFFGGYRPVDVAYAGVFLVQVFRSVLLVKICF